ncbi:MAG TPA: UbiA family prenyltransferase [Actinotalea sp.]|nr:UbiA family prenyltransferase [Actinotalea sp.]
MPTAVIGTVRVLPWIRAAHGAPALLVTAIGGALAAAAGAGAARTALVASAVLAGQLSMGWSNDWIEAARDRRSSRRDKPVVADGLDPAALRRAALGALPLCAVLSLAAGWVAGGAHLVAVCLAWAYNARLKATWWSWAPYAGAFGLLPLFAVLGGTGQVPAGWVVLAGALLGTGAHVANVLPDLADDEAAGVRGLPHRLGRRASGALAPGLLLTGTAVAVLGPGWSPGSPRAAPARDRARRSRGSDEQQLRS